MSKTELLVEKNNGYWILTLNRPDRLNALTAELIDAVNEMMQVAQADPMCRAIVLTGMGRGFSAGQDLEEANKHDDLRNDIGLALERHYNPLVEQMRSMSIPIIAAVNGVAAGAGASLVFACDIIYAARSASFLQAFSKIGLVPDAGGTWFLPRLVGPQRARALMMLAEPLSAEKAETWGLVWKVCDDESLLKDACDLAADMATRPTLAFGNTKALLDASENNTLTQQLWSERESQQLLGKSHDFKEGVIAFLEKRKPVFKGS